MIGIDRNTGAAVDDWLQFVQRATRALTTPVGTRQKRPLYGSKIPQLLGQNLGDDLLILAQSHAADAFYNANKKDKGQGPSKRLARDETNDRKWKHANKEVCQAS